MRDSKEATVSASGVSSIPEKASSHRKSPSELKNARAMISMAILFCVNLLNYMDRYTIAGVLTSIQSYYEINDSQGGLLQTVFIIFFMTCSPVSGYFGDRYNRKYIMIIGITIWVAAVLASTFVPKDKFWLFLLFRGIVGVGEASYAIVSPTIIADLFTGQSRSRMLMFFYFAIPCGSGLGFMVSSAVAALTGQWAWGVRITAIFGVFCLLMIIIFVKEPERGAAERKKGEIAVDLVTTSYWDDIKSLVSTPTYVLATLGYTAMVFVVGVLTFWGPTAIVHSTAHHLGLSSTQLLEPEKKAHINLIFGIITCVGGIVGVTIGSLFSMALRSGKGPFKMVQTSRSDPIVCGIGAILSMPALFCALHTISDCLTLCYAMIFLTILAMCWNWAVNVDMLMAVIVPCRRNAASSWQILISHLFGDASGPYLIGFVSDLIRGDDTTPRGHCRSLATAFYLPNALQLISGIIFLAAAYTFVKDHNKFKEYMGVLKPAHSTSGEGRKPECGQENRAYSITERQEAWAE